MECDLLPYADAGDAGQQDMIHELAPEAKAFVNERSVRRQEAHACGKRSAIATSPIRARVEHAFGVIKGVFKFTKVGTAAWPRTARGRSWPVRWQLVYGARPFVRTQWSRPSK